MKLDSDAPFRIKDENYLFEIMGITMADEHKLQQIFGSELNHYMSTRMILTENSVSTSKPSDPLSIKDGTSKASGTEFGCSQQANPNFHFPLNKGKTVDPMAAFRVN